MGKRLTLCTHPCLTPLYFKGIQHDDLKLVHRNFIYQGYAGDMLNRREQLHGERPGKFRISADDAAGVDPRFSDAVGVLVDEAPILEREELLSRQEWQLAWRVATSKRLCKSELLPKFLLYVCEQHLAGNSHEITEQRIGTQIFNRGTDYNPGEDNIVRSYARLLRKRLDEYFEGEGRDEPMRIVIPRGGYVPAFLDGPEVQEPKSYTQASVEETELPITPEVVAAAPEVTVDEDAVSGGSESRWRLSWLLVFLGLLLGLLASAGWLAARSMLEEKEQSPAHAIWAQLFQRNRNTLIVPADSGLGILQNLTGHLVPLEEYANGTYLIDMKSLPGLSIENLNDLRRQRYTSVVDLNITSMLTRLPEFAANPSKIRYARSITTEDLKSSNAILLGSSHTNPWVSLFDKKLNFKLEYTPEINQSFVLNQHPVNAEQKMYFNGTDATANRTYGVIDYMPSLDGVGHVLIIQGLNMAATQAAADTLFNANGINTILQQASSNGSLKSFELLVETSSIGATASGAQIIATRFYPQ